MSTVLKNDVHNNIAQIVYTGILSRTTRAYFFLGKTDQWDTGDSTPEAPDSSRKYEAKTRSDIIGMKYVSISDVSFAIDRVDWSSGTVYDMYDDRYSSLYPAPSGAQDIADAQMFVLTDEFNIYKCISNNYNSPSTIKPTGTPATGYIGALADGYIWKYMGTVSQVARAKFLTPDYLPIDNTATVIYETGITGFNKINGGSGYVQENVGVAVTGPQVPTRQAQIDAIVDPDGSIQTLTIVDPGEGYTSADITIQNQQEGLQQGTGAVFTAIITEGNIVSEASDVSAAAVDGELSFLYVIDSGSGYSENTQVQISGDGTSQATATAIIVGGEILGITLNDRGENYTNATVQITDSGGGTGAQVDVILAPNEGHGRDLVRESFANILGFQATTTDDINQSFLLENDYRQSGLIFNPDGYTTGVSQPSKYFNSYGSTCFRVDIANSDFSSYSTTLDDFSLDQKIYNQTTGRYLTVIAKKNWMDGETVQGFSLLLLPSEGAVPEVGDTYQTVSNEILFDISANSVITNPEVDSRSGSMAFISNRTPFRKSVEQIVNIRTFIEF